MKKEKINVGINFMLIAFDDSLHKSVVQHEVVSPVPKTLTEDTEHDVLHRLVIVVIDVINALAVAVVD